MPYFNQGLNYIIDCYATNSNSAIAANSFFRSWLGAGFPMFAIPMVRTSNKPIPPCHMRTATKSNSNVMTSFIIWA